MGALITAVAKVTDVMSVSGNGVTFTLKYLSGRRGMASPQPGFPTKVNIINGVVDRGTEVEVQIRQSGGKCTITEITSGKHTFIVDD